MTNYSEAAKAYVETERKKLVRSQALWMDVAEAYDAGMRHGIEARRNAVRQLHGGPRCRVCGHLESAGIHSQHLYGKPAPMGSGEYHEFILETA